MFYDTVSFRLFRISNGKKWPQTSNLLKFIPAVVLQWCFCTLFILSPQTPTDEGTGFKQGAPTDSLTPSQQRELVNVLSNGARESNPGLLGGVPVAYLSAMATP